MVNIEEFNVYGYISLVLGYIFLVVMKGLQRVIFVFVILIMFSVIDNKCEELGFRVQDLGFSS